ncbi:fungal-specific transcription factor domain-containing protein [Podospora fimiseda]|uniref:Fungal-specific transcription factor domain-containing protein n=1 Tax=Podospora fimiseda TaxID=252190 RepID=A0AAN7BSL2_9PEZI|nr:fungal-specific transcription factor domain-containing protein [Podospora fimiseda]
MTTFIKEHKWVNNHGQPPSKRRRINAACLTCRKRKTRCAGEKPICTTCSKNGHHCLGYNDLDERRNSLSRGTALPKIADNEAVIEDFEDDIKLEQSEWSSQNEDDNHNQNLIQETNGGDHSEPQVESGPSTSKPKPRPMAGFVDPLVVSRREATPNTTSAAGQRRKPSDDWEKDDDSQKSNKKLKSSDTRTSSQSDDCRSSIARSLIHRQTESRRVPYFRYFGPTAIVPGFKQMVVDVQQSKHRDRRKSRGGSFSTTSPSSLTGHGSAVPQHYTESGHIIETLEDMPSYDVNDSSPVHPLITGLCQTFFAHLGCDYRFLKPERFFRLLDEKRVEPILVDAMCALAARFSDLPIFINEHDGKEKRSEYGEVFAQRAKAAAIDTFPCPSVAAVQAFLMLAYEGFGANQDSALWMYLGCAIRMAIDLGLPRKEGVKYQGERDPWYTRSWNHRDRDGSHEPDGRQNGEKTLSLEEQAELEQERIDTFWAVFVLDRIISSGTGRPVNFRDGDFELSFPLPDPNPSSGWPDPFPIFLEIIHLYGRASDVLNNLRDVNDLTEDKLQKLAQMEHDLTCIHSKQDPRLTFFPEFFRGHVLIGQGTPFILMHFWFHALVIVLHQPTLLTPFYNKRPLRLSPNSHELAISSAKTIADILSFSELLDPKSFTWNPFTSQPIYIAACCFLMDSVANPSQPSSREPSPFPEMKARILKSAPGELVTGPMRHSLLASAANQNYQRCYKCLQDLEQYWGGVRYILTALDQKSKGIWDCETFTEQEYDALRAAKRTSVVPKPEDLVAYSLTGTTNSPNTNLTLLYQLNSQPAKSTALPPPQPPAPPTVPVSAATPPGNMPFDPVRQHHPDGSSNMFPPPYPQPNISAVRYQPHTPKLLAPLPLSPATSKATQVKYESSPSDLDMRSATMSYPPSFSNDHSPSTTTPTDSGIGMHHGQHNNQQHQHHNQGHGHENGNGNHHNNHHPNNHHVNNHHPHNNHHEFSDQFSAMQGTYYLGINPVTETIAFDNQEVNFDMLGLQSDMMPPWLEILPDNILGGLVDGGLFHHGSGHGHFGNGNGQNNNHGNEHSGGYGHGNHGLGPHHNQHHHGHGQHT